MAIEPHEVIELTIEMELCQTHEELRLKADKIKDIQSRRGIDDIDRRELLAVYQECSDAILIMDETIKPEVKAARMAKKPNASELAMYGQFMAENVFCWACGFSLENRTTGVEHGFSILENAHIIGGPGRRHDRRAINRLCNGCHCLAHGARIVIGGVLLPTISRGSMLWLKREDDPDHFDIDYLSSISTRRILEDDIEAPDEWFYEEFKKRAKANRVSDRFCDGSMSDR